MVDKNTYMFLIKSIHTMREKAQFIKMSGCRLDVWYSTNSRNFAFLLMCRLILGKTEDSLPRGKLTGA
jgi:hypothetical protein